MDENHHIMISVHFPEFAYPWRTFTCITLEDIYVYYLGGHLRVLPRRTFTCIASEDIHVY